MCGRGAPASRRNEDRAGLGAKLGSTTGARRFALPPLGGESSLVGFCTTPYFNEIHAKNKKTVPIRRTAGKHKTDGRLASGQTRSKESRALPTCSKIRHRYVVDTCLGSRRLRTRRASIRGIVATAGVATLGRTERYSVIYSAHGRGSHFRFRCLSRTCVSVTRSFRMWELTPSLIPRSWYMGQLCRREMPTVRILKFIGVLYCS